MTNPNYTHISILIDESGSMQHLAADTIGGFNSFIEEQRLVEGKATVSVHTFSTRRKTLSSMVPIKEATLLDRASYSPSGGTALNDALGQSIIDLGKDLSDLPEEDRPGKVLFIVITDGEENSSCSFSKEQVKSMVEQQESIYKWNFIYLGANVDSFAESSSIGIRGANTLNYDASADGIRGTYTVLSGSIGSSRIHAKSDASLSFYGQASDVEAARGIDFDQVFKIQSATNGDQDPGSTP